MLASGKLVLQTLLFQQNFNVFSTTKKTHFSNRKIFFCSVSKKEFVWRDSHRNCDRCPDFWCKRLFLWRQIIIALKAELEYLITMSILRSTVYHSATLGTFGDTTTIVVHGSCPFRKTYGLQPLKLNTTWFVSPILQYIKWFYVDKLCFIVIPSSGLQG